jgi:hypothetical protein
VQSDKVLFTRYFSTTLYRVLNRGRASHRATVTKVKEKVVNLYLNDKYHASNISHFTELLAIHEGIILSRTTVNSILSHDDLLSPKAHKKTRRRQTEILKKQLEKEASKEQAILLSEKIIALEDAHPMRPRMKYRGELIQLNASQHDWFSDDSYAHLHVDIDDASGDIVGAYF